MKKIEVIQYDKKGYIKYSNTFEYTPERFRKLSLMSDFVILFEDSENKTVFLAKEQKMFNTVIWRGFIRPWKDEDNTNKINSRYNDNANYKQTEKKIHTTL